jgi:hypothetical protein
MIHPIGRNGAVDSILDEGLVTGAQAVDISISLSSVEHKFVWANTNSISITLMKLQDVMNQTATEDGDVVRYPRDSPQFWARKTRERREVEAIDDTAKIPDGLLI